MKVVKTSIKTCALLLVVTSISTSWLQEVGTAYGATPKGNDEPVAIIDVQKVNAPKDLMDLFLKDKGIMGHGPRGSVNIFKESAASGDVDAQKRLAVCYYIGAGTQMDHVSARKWFRKAADENDKKSQYALGFMNEYGEGGPVDKREALKMYLTASEGHDQYSALAQKATLRMLKDFPKDEAVKVKKEVVDWYNLSNQRKTKREKKRRPY